MVPGFWFGPDQEFWPQLMEMREPGIMANIVARLDGRE
jgi:hypothetical protein